MDDNGIQPDCFTAARRWSSNASVIRGSQPKTSLSGIFLRSTLLFIAFANIIPGDKIFTEEKKKVLYKEQKNARTIHVEKKVYPNDPCPCGSGKKYKKCCGKNK